MIMTLRRMEPTRPRRYRLLSRARLMVSAIQYRTSRSITPAAGPVSVCSLFWGQERYNTFVLHTPISLERAQAKATRSEYWPGGVMGRPFFRIRRVERLTL